MGIRIDRGRMSPVGDPLGQASLSWTVVPPKKSACSAGLEPALGNTHQGLPRRIRDPTLGRSAVATDVDDVAPVWSASSPPDLFNIASPEVNSLQRGINLHMYPHIHPHITVLMFLWNRRLMVPSSMRVGGLVSTPLRCLARKLAQRWTQNGVPLH